VDEDQIVDELGEIGLTEYQSRAYLAAVSLGSADFATVADESDIPRQRIYDVIYSLDERGLIEVHEGESGKQVVAPSPETVLEELKNRQLDEVALRFDRVAEELQQEHAQAEADHGFVTVVNHQSSIRRHVRSAVEEARWWLFLSLDVETYESVAEDVRAVLDQGTTVRLLVQGAESDEAVDSLSFPDGLVVKHRPSADTVVAADRTYGVFRGISALSVSRPTLVTKNENIVEMLQRYSEQFWAAFEPVQTERGFPRRYLSPWHALLDIQPSDVPIDELQVRVEGHATDTGQRGTWDGRITDYELRAHEETGFPVVLPEIARLTVETDRGEFSVGGWDATLEDVAAHGLEVNRT
jgi:sugar-specific transcriptional regulator TrmB